NLHMGYGSDQAVIDQSPESIQAATLQSSSLACFADAYGSLLGGESAAETPATKPGGLEQVINDVHNGFDEATLGDKLHSMFYQGEPATAQVAQGKPDATPVGAGATALTLDNIYHQTVSTDTAHEVDHNMFANLGQGMHNVHNVELPQTKVA